MKRSHWAVLAAVFVVALGAWLLFGGGSGSLSSTPGSAGPGSSPSGAAGQRASATPGDQTSGAARDQTSGAARDQTSGAAREQTTARSTRAPSGTTARPGQRGGATDPESGLPWIAAADLPREARDTLALIDAGGPFPYAKDGVTFGNFEGILPRQGRGYYREYTVDTPDSRDRGARRIVTGDNDRIFYWTDDHYASFSRIRR